MRFAHAAIVAAMFAAPATAADIENVRSLDMTVQGTIAQRCAMGTIGNMDFGDLNRPGLGAVARVSLDCNIPFNMQIRAQNGWLAHQQMPSGQGPYSGSLPYTIGVSMPIRKPRTSVVARNFEGRELQGAGRTISSEGGIAVDGMALSVALGRPSGEAGLLAGEYGETIEITITPS
ncbi:hypothetical protein RCO27_17375 [Sphingosinicella sp. LHD-64]|uniref:hypothetical protein n=1 Tax=Sphingosinicella sp. LHD-64 TaxID=3072139 RepID=UPI00280F7075|nr:hypothetical protein [Sphingosinicella sp. LHD-64]MDQ8758000.1 hypothetical protein [Sphingosinicella sp. LHD-64]